MTMAHYIKKQNRLAFLLAVLHWMLSFATDRFVFTYHLFDFSNSVTIAKAILAWGAKGMFLLFLLLLWQGIFYVIKGYQEGNEALKQYWNTTVIYLGIMLVLFVFLFPGIWRLDEFGILKNATQILPHFWQGYLTSVFYIVALMLIPNPAGVILVQILVISMVVGYVIDRFGKMIHHKKLKYILYIPFLLFPVIDSNFYPIRMSIYAFLELLFAFALFDFKYNKREIKSSHVWCLAGLAGILVCWRTESIYYVVLAPLTFLILFHKETTKKMKKQFIILTLLFSGVLSSVQIMGNKIESSKEYELTSIVLPITPLVNQANQNGDTDLLKKVDLVLDVKVLLEGYKEGKSGIAMYWDESLNLKRSYTDNDFEQMKQAYYELIVKYPNVFLTERTNTFFNSTGLLNDTQNLFSKDARESYIKFREAYSYQEPPLRSDIIKIIEFTNKETIHNIVYSFVIQTLCLFITCFVLLIRRKWGYFFICAMICAKIPLIFLTAPSQLFMYYYSIYLIGAVLMGMLFIVMVDKIKDRMERA